MSIQAVLPRAGDGAVPRRKVLVIDDEPSIVDLVRYAVGFAGSYDVIVAYDGVEGLERFEHERPDCVIVDVRMPRLDGYQVVQRIRGDDTTAQTPLIILSALADESEQVRGFLCGVDEFLAKPFRPAVLRATVERVMRITPEERAVRLRRLAAEAAKL